MSRKHPNKTAVNASHNSRTDESAALQATKVGNALLGIVGLTAVAGLIALAVSASMDKTVENDRGFWKALVTSPAQAEALRASKEEHFVSMNAKAETVTMTFEGKAPLTGVETYTTGGRYSSTTQQRGFWTLVEAKDWVLLHDWRGSNTCPHVLGAYESVNAARLRNSRNDHDIAVLAVSLEGRTVPMQVVVPRFTAAPKSLSECEGYSYDAEHGVLKLGTHTVAFMLDDQPGL